MSDITCVWRARYESQKYILNPTQKRNVRVNARPLIISIETTHEGHRSGSRKYTNRDVELLKDMFSALQFKEPVIWTDTVDGNEGGKLYTKDHFLGSLKELSKQREFTSEADMFLCVVLAHGDEGYFCLPNNGYSDGLTKVLFTEVIDIFKGSNCPGLILKPKILIAQTCDFFLRKIDRSEFQGGQGAPENTKVPIEIDLFFYQSTISGKYMKYIKKKDAEFYRNLGDEVDQDSKGPSTPLVYNLLKSVREMRAGGKTVVNLDELVIEVNKKIEMFVKSENWRIRDGNKSWNYDNLKIPLCLNQMTKELDIPLS